MLGSRAPRIASALLAAAFVAWALADDALIGGAPGFGWTQAAVLIAGLVLGASCAAPPAWNGRLLALTLSIGLTLLVVEIGLRSFYSARYYRPFQFDPRSIYRLSPGATREHRVSDPNGEEPILYRINRAGFRGEELAAAGGRPRIVVYGDSFIQAEFSPLPETFAERLEARVSDRLGVPVEVVNAGVAGYGPDQILNKMEEELADLAPNLVIVSLFAGNDFGDPVRNKLYRLDARGELDATPFSIDPVLARQIEVARRESIVKIMLRISARRLLTALGHDGEYASEPGATLRQRVKSMTPRDRMGFFVEQHTREYEEYVVRGDLVVRELAWDSYDADVSLTPTSASAKFKTSLLDGIVERMAGVTEAADIPLVLLLIPHPVDVGGHDSMEVDRDQYPEYRPNELTDRLEAIATRHGIAHVNLYDPFRQRGSRELYFRGLDDHWNERGQDLAAEEMTEFLASTGMLDALARGLARSAGGGRVP